MGASSSKKAKESRKEKISSSKSVSKTSTNNFDEVFNEQAKLQKLTSIPLEIQCAHFTPSTFPMMPIVDPSTFHLCDHSWRHILEMNVSDDMGTVTSGVTAFYRDFYDRLDKVDSNGGFEAVLSRHTGADAQSQIIAKGAILVRIIKFALSIARDTKHSQVTLFMLGKMHFQLGIRPYMYSVFIQTLLLTISARLETKATNDVMEAWVNIFGYILRSLLPPAIRGQVVETEMYVNTSSEFSSGKVLDEVAELEEVRGIKKKLMKSSSSSVASSRRDMSRGDMTRGVSGYRMSGDNNSDNRSDVSEKL